MRLWIFRLDDGGYGCIEDDEKPSKDDTRWYSKGVSEELIHRDSPDLKKMKHGEIREIESIQIRLKG